MTLFTNFIAGEWVKADKVTRNINPSNTGDVIGEYAQATVAHTEAAIDAARAAFPAWSRTTPQERHDSLKRVGDEILKRKDELGKLLSREEGKTLAEGVGETVRAGQVFLFFAQECLRIHPFKLCRELFQRAGLRLGHTADAVFAAQKMAHLGIEDLPRELPRLLHQHLAVSAVRVVLDVGAFVGEPLAVRIDHDAIGIGVLLVAAHDNEVAELRRVGIPGNRIATAPVAKRRSADIERAVMRRGGTG